MNRFSRLCPALLALLLLPASTFAQPADQDVLSDVHLVTPELRQLIQDGDWAAALEGIDRALAADDPAGDQLLYLKGRVLFWDEQWEAASAALTTLVDNYPDSPWWGRARFAAGLALTRHGDFEAAERLYRTGAENLLDADRKQDLAGICLELANEYFGPTDSEKQPDYRRPPRTYDMDAEGREGETDYERAGQFYEQALNIGLKPEHSAVVQLRIARCWQERGDSQAVRAYESFLSEHPDSPLAVEAAFRLGQSHLEAGDLRAARRAWQDLLARKLLKEGIRSEQKGPEPGEEPKENGGREEPEALAQQASGPPESDSNRLAEAAFDLSRTWGIPNPGSDADMQLGIAALERFLKRFPGHRLAPLAELDIARSLLARDRQEDAAQRLEHLLRDERYQDAEERVAAQRLLGRAYREQDRFEEALAAWQEYLTEYPADPDWSDIQQRVVDTEYAMGLDRFSNKDFDAARQALQQFVGKYPLDARVPGIFVLLARIAYAQEAYDAALDAFRHVVSKYPHTDEASYAQYTIGTVLERELSQPEEAIEAYEKVTWGPYAGRAQTAKTRLTSKSLTIETERVFRSDETPRIKLTTRNLETVHVRVYRLDIPSYFRKIHAADGVENLDISLIDPTVSFDIAIADYADYLELERRVEIPLPGGDSAGAVAVTVASETHEATTLVLQSDLEIIVKATESDVFVFAQNLITGKPWPDARLLISDGEQILLEATTGEDGVYRGLDRSDTRTGDARVLAVAGGHVASNAALQPPPAAPAALTNKGYLLTDRPVYQAGQNVHIRGCVRPVVDGDYQVAGGKSFRLQIVDPRNRILRDDEVMLGEFGSFHTSFRLPLGAPQGEYRIRVDDQAEQQYQGSFQVRPFQPEPVRLTIDSPRRVYYRGETIRGTIEARYEYGTPLAGREIVYQLADDRRYSARTDEQGRVAFELETRDLAESQTLTLTATLAERDLQTTANFHLATQGFAIELSTLRDVFVARTPFPLTVTVTDAAGQPVSQQLTLSVLRLTTTADGTVGERLVQELALETAGDAGVARPNVQLEEGGSYRLRVEGVDRFGNPVSAEHDITVSDDDDVMRLRILADQHWCHAGDTVDVTLLWREAPATALVTFEGNGVLDYRLVPLQTGENKLTLTMQPQFAPNFDLVANVMADPRTLADADQAERGKVATDDTRVGLRLHEASSPFIVQRQLEVDVTWTVQGEADKRPRPGDRLQVSVRTTDPQGAPVAAEVSLALIERSLLARFPWQMPAIDEYFRQAIREPAVRTDSSITFAYRPETQPISQLLLDEQQREELARQEQASWQRNQEAFGGLGGMGGYGGMGGGFFGGGLGGGLGAGEPAAGASGADFSELIGLIQETIEPSGFASSGLIDTAQLSIDLLVQQATDEEGAETEETDTDQPDDFLDATGYWNPSIVTGVDGKANLEIIVPDRVTTWTLVAKGITRETLAGEASGEVIVQPPDVFGELRVPTALTEGDVVSIPALIHSTRNIQKEARVTLLTEIGRRSVQETKSVQLDGPGVYETVFDVRVEYPDDASATDDKVAALTDNVRFQLRVDAAEDQHALERRVPLQPYGLTISSTAGGVADADETAWIEPDAAMARDTRTLQILVGPNIERSLLDVLFGPDVAALPDGRLTGTWAQRHAADLMAALALQDLLLADPERNQVWSRRLDQVVRDTVGYLVSAQADDGGWGWAAAGATSDRATSARILWALSLARRTGYRVQDACFQAAVEYADGQIAATENRDYESKSILLHALATAGRGEFFLANRLVRERAALNPAARLYLALALIEMDRRETARELLTGLAAADLDAALGSTGSPFGHRARSHQPVVLRSLYLLAVLATAPDSPAADELAEWLLAHRRGHRWTPDEATGPATMALCRWSARGPSAGARYRLAILVNDAPVADLELDDRTTTQVVHVPPVRLVEGRQKIDFRPQGRGRYAYQIVLSGYVPAERLTSTTKDWSLRRTYEPAPPEVDGRELSPGFDVVRGTASRFRNSLRQLPAGQRGFVKLRYERDRTKTPLAEPREYLVITDRVPAGAQIVADSVAGDFDRYEVEPGSITFYVGQQVKPGSICYGVYGNLAGQYRVAPAIARDAYRPDQRAVTTSDSLTILPRGQESADPYRLSPDELFQLGSHLFEQGDMAGAEEHLAPLLDQWSLKADAYRRVVGMLLKIQLAVGESADIVRYFETIQEQWPDERIQLDDGLKIAAAYRELGEFERSYLGLRAIVESRFKRESSLAGFLESQQKLLPALRVMQRLLSEYPPEPYTAAAQYALAQQVSAAADSAADNSELVDARLNRADLLIHSWQLLEAYLTDHSQDPAADQAAFSAATTLLELERYAEAATVCQRYANRYPDSRLRDSFWYIIGFCQFAGGDPDAARQALQRVLDASAAATTRQERENSNRWPALYILGQIHHSLEQPGKAIEYYRQVSDRFPDAQQSIDYFLRQEIHCPDVTAVRPGETAEIELTYRNVTSCTARVYRIDLMKFALLHSDLSSITQVNLAGIEPLQTMDVSLGGEQDYRDHRHRLSLDVQQQGAYLIVCRGNERYASGLVLITPLEMEVHHDTDEQRARVVLRDAVQDRYVHDAQIRVVSNGNTGPVSGRTDRRGVFVADAVDVSPTVVARLDADQYAFHRGRSTATPLPPAIARQLRTADPFGGAVGAGDPFGEPNRPAGISVTGGVQQAAERRIKTVLDGPTSLALDEIPLEDVAELLSRQHGILVQLDARALDDVGIGTDYPVTFRGRGISLRSALRLMLKELDLTYAIRDECLLITTPEEAEYEQLTRIYPVTDLVRFQDSDGQAWADFNSLIDAVTSTVAPVTWDAVGGPGSVGGMSYQNTDVLILSQSQDVHDQIEDFLGQLRLVAGAEDGDGKLPIRERPQGYGEGYGDEAGYGAFPGGGFGGMGGMGPLQPGFFGGPAPAAGGQRGARNELLRGLQDTQRRLQGREKDKLQEMYDQGLGGGVGAGGFF